MQKNDSHFPRPDKNLSGGGAAAAHGRDRAPARDLAASLEVGGLQRGGGGGAAAVAVGGGRRGGKRRWRQRAARAAVAGGG